MNKRIAIFSGAGIGLLIGLLMGLTTTPVVGVIISALGSSLAVILGLNDKHNSDNKGLRIGSFGFACIVGVLFGLYSRTHNLITPNLEDLKQEYLNLGYNEEEALAFIKFKEFGILDDSWKMVVEQEVIHNDSLTSTSIESLPEETEQSTNTKEIKNGNSLVHVPKAHSSVLFDYQLKANECQFVKGDRDLELSYEDLKNNIQLGSTSFGNPLWKDLTIVVDDKIEKQFKHKTLLEARDILCELPEPVLKVTSCKSLNPINENSTLKELQDVFKAEASLKNIYKLSLKISSAEIQKRVLITFRYLLCHEK